MCIRDRYNDWEAFVQSPDSAKAKFRLSAGQRYDQAFRNGALTPSTEATNYSASLGLGGKKIRKLAATFTYRQLRIVDTVLTVQPAVSYTHLTLPTSDLV